MKAVAREHIAAYGSAFATVLGVTTEACTMIGWITVSLLALGLLGKRAWSNLKSPARPVPVRIRIAPRWRGHQD
jgi:hypothetical protein